MFSVFREERGSQMGFLQFLLLFFPRLCRFCFGWRAEMWRSGRLYSTWYHNMLVRTRYITWYVYTAVVPVNHFRTQNNVAATNRVPAVVQDRLLDPSIGTSRRFSFVFVL